MVDILIFAIIAGLVTWLGFAIYDKKKKGALADEEMEETPVKKGLFRKSEEPESTHLHGLINYSTYQMSSKEYAETVLLAAIFFFIVGFIFYQNIIVSILFALLGFYYPRIRRVQLMEKRKQDLTTQFKQALYSLSSSLAAGRSVENSFREVVNDLKLLYPDPNTYIIKEFEFINRRIENGETIEEAIEDFSERAGIDDITNFSNVFITCKRTGGDLIEVVRRTANIIGDKLEIQQEISVMISQKKFEAKIMSVAPIVMVAILTMSAGDYMDPLFRLSEGGPFVMTICLVVMGFIYWICQRIMNIKV